MVVEPLNAATACRAVHSPRWPVDETTVAVFDLDDLVIYDVEVFVLPPHLFTENVDLLLVCSVQERLHGYD